MIFWGSNQTFCPFTNGVNVDCSQLAILVLANSCAANAFFSFMYHLFHLFLDCWIFCVVKKDGDRDGLSPRMSSNGVCVLSACLLLL